MANHHENLDPFAETEDQQALRSLARDVADRALAPMARHWDETEEFPQASWDAIRDADLFGITIGERYGGMGMGDIEASIVLEELGRACVSSAILAQLTFNGPPRAIEHLGSDALKEKWLPMAASGEALFCIGISETEAGSAVNHMRARLTPDGDGFRLNAYKNYVTGGHKSRVCLVWCRFPGSEGSKGIGAVVVDLESEGVTVAGTHVKMGLRGTSEAELAFDDVYVAPEDVLLAGDPTNSESFKTLISHINHERCGNASMCVGAAQGALEYAVQYMNERMIGGIAAIIAAYIVVYTVINVGFRKEAPPHEPWAEAERRAADARSGRPGLVVQASMMGWSRLVATLEPAPGAPVSTPMAAVTVSPTPGRLDQALPIELVLIVPGKPALHPSIGGVDAPATLRRGEPLRLRLHVADAGTGPAFGEPLVYAKEGRLHIFIQDASRTARDAAPAPAAEFVSLVVALPPEGLAAGPWTGAVYSEASVFTWSFAAE